MRKQTFFKSVNRKKIWLILVVRFVFFVHFRIFKFYIWLTGLSREFSGFYSPPPQVIFSDGALVVFENGKQIGKEIAKKVENEFQKSVNHFLFLLLLHSCLKPEAVLHFHFSFISISRQHLLKCKKYIIRIRIFWGKK